MVIETKFLDEESYHGYSEDNDNISKTCIKIVDDESYHGESEDNENLEEEVLENITHPLENEWQLTLYHFEKSNNLNLTEDKLRLVQKFIRHPRTFYRFSRDPTIAYPLNTIYEFLITNNCKFIVGGSIFEKPSMISVAPYQYRTTRILKEQEMDHLRPICAMESHVNFCVLYLGWNAFVPELVKIDIYQPSSSFTLGQNCNIHAPMIKEISYEHLDEEVVHFNDQAVN